MTTAKTEKKKAGKRSGAKKKSTCTIVKVNTNLPDAQAKGEARIAGLVTQGYQIEGQNSQGFWLIVTLVKTTGGEE